MSGLELELGGYGLRLRHHHHQVFKADRGTNFTARNFYLLSAAISSQLQRKEREEGIPFIFILLLLLNPIHCFIQTHRQAETKHIFYSFPHKPALFLSLSAAMIRNEIVSHSHSRAFLHPERTSQPARVERKKNSVLPPEF